MPPAPEQQPAEPVEGVDFSLDITASDAHRYDVTIGHRSGATTRHCVDVPESLMADLGLSAAQEPMLLRASLVYLMAHDPAALPERFDLGEVSAALPDYRAEIVDQV